MRRWVERLFEGDTDLDKASSIYSDAGIELYNYEIDDEYDMGGKGIHATSEHLNGGNLKRLFEEYATKQEQCVSKELRYVFLGTCSNLAVPRCLGMCKLICGLI